MEGSEYAQLFLRLKMHPFFPAFSAVLAECVNEGAFKTDQDIAKKAAPPVPHTYSKFCSLHGMKEGHESDEVKEKFNEYRNYQAAFDSARERYKQELAHKLARVKQSRMLLEDEERHRYVQIQQPFNEAKNTLNQIFVPTPAKEKKAAPVVSGGSKKRGTLPKEAVRVLKKWLFEHFSHPYPTDDEKHKLSQMTGLRVSQVNYWFINARVRIWRPMMEKNQGEPPEVPA